MALSECRMTSSRLLANASSPGIASGGRAGGFYSGPSAPPTLNGVSVQHFGVVTRQSVVPAAHLRDQQGGEAEAREGSGGQHRPGEPLRQRHDVGGGHGARHLLEGVPERPDARGGLHLLAQGAVVAHVGVELGLGALGAQPGLLLDPLLLEQVRGVQHAQFLHGEGGQQDRRRYGGKVGDHGPHGVGARRRGRGPLL